jgi:hypothetical protein
MSQISLTDVDRVMKMISEAANGIHRLESDADVKFARWEEAQQEAKKIGITIEMTMGPGMAAAYSEYKRRNSRVEAVRIAEEEMTRRVPPPPVSMDVAIPE